MTLDQFWGIIEKVHRKSGADIDKRFDLLETEVGNLSLAEVQSFDAHFTDCLDRAYTWELWGAAYVIGGGCSDDGFWDFRSTLITCGKKIFERALKDPESLADLDRELGESLQVEGLQFLYPHAKAERASMARALRELQVERGSLLDKEIQQWVFDWNR